MRRRFARVSFVTCVSCALAINFTFNETEIFAACCHGNIMSFLSYEMTQQISANSV